MPTKQKSGLYRARVKIGVKADGTDLYKYVSGRTKKELERAREEVIRHYITGTAPAEDRLFGDYATEWYRLRLYPRASASTREAYKYALNKHILPVFGTRNLRAIKPLDLQIFVDGFADMSASTITYIYAALDRIYSAAVTDRLVMQSPMTSVKKPSARPAEEKPVLTPEQRAIIAHVAATHSRGLYLGLMFYLGVRPGEARGFMWGDIDWSANTIHVQRDIDYKDRGKAGKVKTAKSDRYVPIPDALMAQLRHERGMPDTYIIKGERTGTALSKASAERLWVELMRECGMVVPVDREMHYSGNDIRNSWRAQITAHTLRHNFVTMCWERGIDVFSTSKLVGHSNVTTTQAIYTHLTEYMRKKAAEQVNDMFEAVPKVAPQKDEANKVIRIG